MSEDRELLVEMMLHSVQFCSRAESVATGMENKTELGEFRIKLGQARNALERLQQKYNEDALDVHEKSAMAEFRYLVIALLWMAFYVRHDIDFKLFRNIVSIEASFTYLLIKR